VFLLVVLTDKIKSNSKFWILSLSFINALRKVAVEYVVKCFTNLIIKYCSLKSCVVHQILLDIFCLEPGQLSQYSVCLRTGRPGDRVLIPCRGSVQTGSGAHPASCPMGTGGPFLGGKAQLGHDTDHLPPSSAEVMNE
jgi:hypothetical protein